jgi:hypothetical protein
MAAWLTRGPRQVSEAAATRMRWPFAMRVLKFLSTLAHVRRVAKLNRCDQSVHTCPLAAHSGTCSAGGDALGNIDVGAILTIISPLIDSSSPQSSRAVVYA